MEVSYKRDVNSNYIIISDSKEIDMENFQVRMVLSNQIERLLACKVSSIDDCIYFYYDITSKQSLKNNTLDRLINYKELSGYMESIIYMLEQMEAFLLDAKCIILRPEYLYVSPDGYELYMIYYPAGGMEIRSKLQELLEYILPKIDHKDKLAVALGYDLYKAVLGEQFNLDILKCCLSNLNMEIEHKVVNSSLFEVENLEKKQQHQVLLDEFFSEEEEGEVKTNYRSILCVIVLVGEWIGWYIFLRNYISIIVQCVFSVIAIVMGIIWYRIDAKKEDGKAQLEVEPIVNEEGFTYCATREDCLLREVDNYDGETQVLYGETTLLKESSIHKYKFVYKGKENISDFEIVQEITIVGKLNHSVDVVIPSPAISRIHAKIIKRGMNIAVVDLNSKNGTYINGEILDEGHEKILNLGDKIVFADIVFEFT